MVYKPFNELNGDEVKDYYGPTVEMRIVTREFGQSKVHLSAKDDKSGVAHIYYSLNGSEFNEYRKPVDISDLDEVNIKYYAVDRAGNNSETEKSVYVIENHDKHKRMKYENNKPDKTIR